MVSYRCEVVDPKGRQVRLMRQAASEQACVKELISQGYTPLRLRSGLLTFSEILNNPIRLGGAGGNAEQALLLRQLAILISADMPLDRSLDLLRDQTGSRRQRHIIAEMLSDIKSGRSLAQAIEFRTSFPAWVTGIIRSAESGGNLGGALTNSADRMAKLTATKRQLISALTYPAAVLIATLLALALILTLVVPQFEPIFAGSEDKLPQLTQFVLWLAHNMASWGVGMILGLFVGFFSLYLFLRSSEGGMLRERYPQLFAGQHLRDQYLAGQFAGLFSVLILNDVNVVKALALARDASSSARWRRQLDAALVKVRKGERLSLALSAAPAFPDTVIRLIEVGEQTGKLGSATYEASQIMSDTASQRIENIVSLVNPVAIILLGGVVATLVAGVMLGIFALGDFAG